MTALARLPCELYFPAILRVECDSPIDALVALSIPRQEAMDLVAASWGNREPNCLIATTDGGRPVVVLLTREGRWAACNAFLNHPCETYQEADRFLSKVLRRHHHGYVACIPTRHTALAAGSEARLGCPARGMK